MVEIGSEFHSWVGSRQLALGAGVLFQANLFFYTKEGTPALKYFFRSYPPVVSTYFDEITSETKKLSGLNC